MLCLAKIHQYINSNFEHFEHFGSFQPKRTCVRKIPKLKGAKSFLHLFPYFALFFIKNWLHLKDNVSVVRNKLKKWCHLDNKTHTHIYSLYIVHMLGYI